MLTSEEVLLHFLCRVLELPLSNLVKILSKISKNVFVISSERFMEVHQNSGVTTC